MVRSRRMVAFGAVGHQSRTVCEDLAAGHGRASDGNRLFTRRRPGGSGVGRNVDSRDGFQTPGATALSGTPRGGRRDSRTGAYRLRVHQSRFGAGRADAGSFPTRLRRHQARRTHGPAWGTIVVELVSSAQFHPLHPMRARLLFERVDCCTPTGVNHTSTAIPQR
jgi:hypothetical protein